MNAFFLADTNCTANDSTAYIMAKLTNQSNFYNSWALKTPVLTLIMT